MGEIRTTARFKEILEEVETLGLKKGLTLIASHIGGSVEEEQEATKYSQSSGKPEKHEWVGRPWDGVHYFQFTGVESRFASEVLAKLPVDECAVLETVHGPVVVYHHSGDTDTGERGGTSPSHLIFKKPISL